MGKLKYIIIALVLVASVAYAGINDRFSPIELTDYTGNLVSEYDIQLSSVFVDGTGPISSVSTPNLTTVDNVGAIVYDTSGETTEIQFQHVPSPAFAGLEVTVLATSDQVSGITQLIDWSIIYNRKGASIGTAIAQTGVSFSNQRMDVNVDECKLTLNQAGINAVKAGDGVIGINIWNAGKSVGTTEIKGITVKELWKTD